MKQLAIYLTFISFYTFTSTSALKTQTVLTGEYEDYSKIAKSYDATRVPIGIPFILGELSTIPTPLDKQILIDGGCGSGNYIVVLKNNIGFIYGVDINKTMIEKAEGKIKKTSKNSSNVTFVHASILEYPFQENFCHAILVNQIIHHLETEKTVDSYTNTKLMFKEAYRILQPNGLLIMNISTHEQWYDGFWFYELLPGARDKLIKRHASMDSLIAFAKEAKLELKSIYTPVSEILQSSSYFNPTGPLEKVFRDGDSTWALASEQELASALNFIETKAKNGTLQAYFEKRDALRKRIGQTTFLVFRKP